MATDTKLQELVINTMTKAQYDALETKDPNEIYVATDAKIGAHDLGTSNAGSAGQVLSKTADGMEWADAAGGLPDQTGHSGFLQTDGTNVAWSDKEPFVDFFQTNTQLALGFHAAATGTASVAVGTDAGAQERATVAVGGGAQTLVAGGIAIGASAQTAATGAIQLSATTNVLAAGVNSDRDTFKVCNNNGNFQLMNPDGTIPSERLAADGTAGQVLSKTDTGMEWIDAGGATGDYLPLSGGTIIGNFLSSNPAITVSSEGSDVYAFTMGQSGGYGVSFYANANGGFTISPFGGTKYLYFGNMLYNNKTYKLSNVKILNNGADINIPTTGGTMVVATPPTDEGTYTLKATVAADGTVTTVWVKDA